jgi:hypothetical protein
MTSIRLQFIRAPLIAAALACAAGACSTPSANQTSSPDSGTFTGESAKLDVSGAYQPLAIDQVDGFAREDGRIVVRGPSGRVPLDVPAIVDQSQPNPAWRLVTESNRDGQRHLTFTHETSLDDFTIALPASQAELHYGAFLSTEGGSVLLFAWGDGGHCYWGYATIKARS